MCKGIYFSMVDARYPTNFSICSFIRSRHLCRRTLSVILPRRCAVPLLDMHSKVVFQPFLPLMIPTSLTINLNTIICASKKATDLIAFFLAPSLHHHSSLLPARGMSDSAANGYLDAYHSTVPILSGGGRKKRRLGYFLWMQDMRHFLRSMHSFRPPNFSHLSRAAHGSVSWKVPASLVDVTGNQLAYRAFPTWDFRTPLFVQTKAADLAQHLGLLPQWGLLFAHLHGEPTIC